MLLLSPLSFFHSVRVRVLCLERALTILYKYYCLETFSLGMLPVLLLFLPVCELPPRSRCTQWVVCESLSYLTSDPQSCLWS